MSKNLSIATVILLAILVSIFVIHSSNEKYSWYQETTITVTMNEQVYESKTINQVTWKHNRPIAKGLHADPWTVSVEGGAPFIELPNEVVLALTLDGRDKFGLSRTLLDNQLLQEYGNIERVQAQSITGNVLEQFLESEKSSVNIDIPSYVFPTVLGFIDRNNPETMFIVEPTSPLMSESGISEVEITVSHINTGTPDITGLLEVLSWLNDEPFVISATTLDGNTIKIASSNLAVSN